jgi:hypothetical protein
MRQKEAERRLRRALSFPHVWFSSGLMSGVLQRQQLSSLRRHFGTRSRPIRGSEHWRYGAFWHVLRNATDEAVLVKLLSVAYADPETLMGEEMVKDIQRHQLAGSEVQSSNQLLKARRAERPRAP